MATSVNAAFAEFMRDFVNLDSNVTKTARASRDWLIGQIHGFEGNVEHFPGLYTEKDIAFGSFARNTKIRELDDIDLMFCIKAQGATYVDYGDRVEITAPESSGALSRYCNPGTDALNSRMVINKFVSALGSVPQYEDADTKRDHEAATLKLTSYTWNFDIVPCFFTTPETDERTYYIIPDGNGNWKKTDPRKDRDALSVVNTAHGGNVLNPLRLLKYWNERPTAPAMGSYLVETMAIIHYVHRAPTAVTQYVDMEMPDLFQHIANSIFGTVPDLKDVQGDLNDLSLEQRWKIQERANQDYARALEARAAETSGDHAASIRKWREIFGPYFPTYG
jgi:hypothetical protein